MGELMSNMKTNLLCVLMAICTGIGFALLLSGIDFFWLAWVVFVPFIIVIRRVSL